MARVKRGVTAHAKHKKVLKKAKGYYGRTRSVLQSRLLRKLPNMLIATARSASATSVRSGFSVSTLVLASMV